MKVVLPLLPCYTYMLDHLYHFKCTQSLGQLKMLKLVGASQCNLTDEVTTCPMMTSLRVIELIMLGLA